MSTIDMTNVHSVDTQTPFSKPANPAPQSGASRRKGCGCGMMILAACVAFCIVIVIGIVSALSLYNGLIDKQENVKSSFSDIDTQLQRRVDLIPNLVATAKGIAKHEEKVFSALSEARSKLIGAKSVSEKAEASAQVNTALNRLLAIKESYPDLKSNTNFLRLQDELAGTENRIAVARTRYNEKVRTFNAEIKKFPASIFAAQLQMKDAEYFQPSADKKKLETAPTVSF